MGMAETAPVDGIRVRRRRCSARLRRPGSGRPPGTACRDSGARRTDRTNAATGLTDSTTIGICPVGFLRVVLHERPPVHDRHEQVEHGSTSGSSRSSVRRRFHAVAGGEDAKASIVEPSARPPRDPRRPRRPAPTALCGRAQARRRSPPHSRQRIVTQTIASVVGAPVRADST